MKRSYIYSATVAAAIAFMGALSAHAQVEGRYATPAPEQTFSKVTATAASAAGAIMTPRAVCLYRGSTMAGNPNQSQVFATSLQGFPTNGSDYLVLSTGYASQTAGTAPTFVSHDMGGPSLPGNAPQSSPDGEPSYDVTTFRLIFSVPATAAASLSFDWRFGSEENPEYLEEYTDYFRADVFDGSNTHLGNIARLPNNAQVTTSAAAAYSNAPGGNSGFPSPPFPTPNDVVYNAMTGLYTSSIDLTAYAGQYVTIQFRIADVIDDILNSVVFIDNLDLRVVPDFNVSLSPNYLWPPNHTMHNITAAVDAGSGNCFDWELTSVTSNEPDNGDDDGNTVDDIQGVDAGIPDSYFQVRAERSGIGTGRIYTATFTIFDANGDSWVQTATVNVPLNQMTKLSSANGILPAFATLEQNYPNPFNPSTTINFAIPIDGDVRLSVYNSLGMEVARLVDASLQAGSYMYSFDASALSGGTYFYMLQHNGMNIQKNMQLLK